MLLTWLLPLRRPTQVVEVECLLYDGTRVRAATLQAAPASLHSGERQALPSRRYLNLLKDGAACCLLQQV